MGDHSNSIQECSERDGAEQVNSCEQKRVYTIYYSFYFDGTLNNFQNTRAYGRAQTDSAREALSDLGDSYLNDYSNVARQWRRQRSNNSGADNIIVKTRYTEGIGTRNQGEDSSIGAGLGTDQFIGSNTGIEAKCRSAMRAMKRELRRVSNLSDCERIELHFDVFGFSRGAAAARHYIHLVQMEDLSAYRVTKNYRFAGLYDTVSAHGVVHSNDVRDLNLNKLNLPSKVVQLAAADEHRYNFELTNVDSGGVQYYLPGVHSDIGGGYKHNKPEQLLLRRERNRRTVEADKRALERSGYFVGNDLQIVAERTGSLIHGPGISWYNLRSYRRSISNQYSKAVLQLMIDEFMATGGAYVEFIHNRFRITDPRIQGVYDFLVGLMSGGAIPLSRWNNPAMNLGGITLAGLRNRYCHFSAHLAGIVAGIVKPHRPNIVGNARIRETFSG